MTKTKPPNFPMMMHRSPSTCSGDEAHSGYKTESTSGNKHRKFDTEHSNALFHPLYLMCIYEDSGGASYIFRRSSAGAVKAETNSNPRS